ncbi:hypothetical protein DY000_02040717 [Brassica cretica]|uniref:Uncharacterized protein n=1 Tax=Brassica cretica TaxID=69181 RepID=A0ABQ7BCQ5_BRACR|nr:hypothetical protein DY000_02040717 [Brassica cretica]
MFSEKENQDDKIKELEVVAKELASAIETATARTDSLKADLFASISREAILRAQEVARAVRAEIVKYRGCLERVKEYLADQKRRGYPIPWEKLARHKTALWEYTDLLDNTDVAALDEDDLVLSSLPSSSQD